MKANILQKAFRKVWSPQKCVKDNLKDNFNTVVFGSMMFFVNIAISLKHKIRDFYHNTKTEYAKNFKYLKYNLSWLTNESLTSEILTVAMTKKCNLECTYCWDTGNRDNLSELRTEEVKKILDSAWKMGVRKFNPFGGEPFIRHDMFEILEYAFAKGFEVTLTTNGTLISEKKCIEIVNRVPAGKKRKFIFLVSLDGSGQEENDYIRGKNSFRKTIEFLEILTRERKAQNKNFGIIINTVVSRNNFRSMKKMVELCERIGADNIHFITPTISLDSKMHMSEMVRRNLVIMPEEFSELDANIDEMIKLVQEGYLNNFILNQMNSLKEFKGFFRRQYEQHLPYIKGEVKVEA